MGLSIADDLELQYDYFHLVEGADERGHVVEPGVGGDVREVDGPVDPGSVLHAVRHRRVSVVQDDAPHGVSVRGCICEVAHQLLLEQVGQSWGILPTVLYVHVTDVICLETIQALSKY